MMTERFEDLKLRTAVAETIGLNVLPTEAQMAQYNKECGEFAELWKHYGSELGKGPSRPVGPDHYKMLPYETSLEAAFGALDKIIDRIDGTVEVTTRALIPGSGNTPEFQCRIDAAPMLTEGKPPANWLGIGSTLQLAICRAVVAAGKDINDGT
jgi:hypothetical protein